MATITPKQFSQNFGDYNLSFPGIRLPEIDVPKGYNDNKEYLRELCYKGFEEKLRTKKIDPNKAQEYTDRCQYELETFEKYELVDYVLLVKKVIDFCRQKEIPRGGSRGSVSGSLVFYLTGSIEIDPIIHNLYFSRFVNEARVKVSHINGIVYLNGKLPDCDSDLSYKRRGEVLNHVYSLYPQNVAKISNFSTFQSKALLKEVVKSYLEYSEEQAQKLSEYINKLFGNVEKITDTYEENEKFREWADNNLKTYKIIKKLQGLGRQKSTHASGLAVTHGKIRDELPLELSKNGDIVTSYDMETVGDLAIKLDLLGLKNADVNFECAKLVDINIDSIDINNESIYDFLNYSDCFYGLFQVEAGLTKRVVQKVRPKNFDQLAACLAVSRPGAYKYIDEYVKFVHEGERKFFHPEIDKILERTGSVILYQEQINEICYNVYKLSLQDADNVRDCIGKKKVDKIKEWEPVIFKKGEENNIPEETTKRIWQTIKDSGSYLLNLNHCTAYCYNTCLNTYLKANYPREFFLALLKTIKESEQEPVKEFQKVAAELPHFGISLLPPHILKSDINFKLEDDGIRFGLGSIKSVSDKTIDKLNDFKHEYANKFEVFEAAKNAKLDVKTLSSLILVGALDDAFNQDRNKIVFESRVWNLLKVNEKKHCFEIGDQFNYDLIDTIKYLNQQLKDKKGNPIIKESRMATIRKHSQPYYKIYQHNHKIRDFVTYYFEKRLLGVSYSYSLYNILNPKISDLTTINQFLKEDDDHVARVCGEIEDFEIGKTKEKGNKKIKLTVDDDSETMYIFLFSDRANEFEVKYKDHLKKGAIIVARGKKKNNCMFAEAIGIQDTKVVESPKDIKND